MKNEIIALLKLEASLGRFHLLKTVACQSQMGIEFCDHFLYFNFLAFASCHVLHFPLDLQECQVHLVLCKIPFHGDVLSPGPLHAYWV